MSDAPAQVFVIVARQARVCKRHLAAKNLHAQQSGDDHEQEREAAEPQHIGGRLEDRIQNLRNRAVAHNRLGDAEQRHQTQQRRRRRRRAARAPRRPAAGQDEHRGDYDQHALGGGGLV